MTACSSSLDFVVTMGSVSAAALKILPAGVLPEPSAPWHITQCTLKRSAPGSCPCAGKEITAARQIKSRGVGLDFKTCFLPSVDSSSGYVTQQIHCSCAQQDLLLNHRQ